MVKSLERVVADHVGKKRINEKRMFKIKLYRILKGSIKRLKEKTREKEDC